MHPRFEDRLLGQAVPSASREQLSGHSEVNKFVQLGFHTLFSEPQSGRVLNSTPASTLTSVARAARLPDGDDRDS
jgi:hypothetical protein